MTHLISATMLLATMIIKNIIANEVPENLTITKKDPENIRNYYITNDQILNINLFELAGSSDNIKVELNYTSDQIKVNSQINNREEIKTNLPPNYKMLDYTMTNDTLFQLAIQNPEQPKPESKSNETIKTSDVPDSPTRPILDSNSSEDPKIDLVDGNTDTVSNTGKTNDQLSDYKLLGCEYINSDGFINCEDKIVDLEPCLKDIQFPIKKVAFYKLLSILELGYLFIDSYVIYVNEMKIQTGFNFQLRLDQKNQQRCKAFQVDMNTMVHVEIDMSAVKQEKASVQSGHYKTRRTGDKNHRVYRLNARTQKKQKGGPNLIKKANANLNKASNDPIDVSEVDLKIPIYNSRNIRYKSYSQLRKYIIVGIDENKLEASKQTIKDVYKSGINFYYYDLFKQIYKIIGNTPSFENGMEDFQIMRSGIVIQQKLMVIRFDIQIEQIFVRPQKYTGRCRANRVGFNKLCQKKKRGMSVDTENQERVNNKDAYFSFQTSVQCLPRDKVAIGFEVFDYQYDTRVSVFYKNDMTIDIFSWKLQTAPVQLTSRKEKNFVYSISSSCTDLYCTTNNFTGVLFSNSVLILQNCLNDVFSKISIAENEYEIDSALDEWMNNFRVLNRVSIETNRSFEKEPNVTSADRQLAQKLENSHKLQKKLKLRMKRSRPKFFKTIKQALQVKLIKTIDTYKNFGRNLKTKKKVQKNQKKDDVMEYLTKLQKYSNQELQLNTSKFSYYQTNSVKWFAENSMFLANSTNILVIRQNPQPVIEINKLQANTSITLDYTIGDLPTNGRKILNFYVLEASTEFYSRFPVVHTSRLLNQASSGRFITSTSLNSNFFIGNQLEISISCKYNPYSHCKGFDGNNICQCYPEWDNPSKIGGYCSLPTLVQYKQNCVELSDTKPKLCNLCKPNYVLQSNSGVCKKGSCPKGCKFCNENQCLVCDLGYIKNPDRNLTNCVDFKTYNQKSTDISFIQNCKYEKTNSQCYQCQNNHVVSSDGKKCLPTNPKANMKFQGCRQLTIDISDNQICKECLEHKTANPDGTCTVPSPIKVEVLSVIDMNPRKFNLSTLGLFSNNIFHYAVSTKMIHNKFITIIQLGLYIYQNECTLASTGGVRCINKLVIQETSQIQESVLTSKLFAYRTQAGYNIRIFKHIQNNLTITNNEMSCSSYRSDDYLQACADIINEKINIFKVDPIKNVIEEIKVISNIYGRGLVTSEIYRQTLFVKGMDAIFILDAESGVMLTTIKSDQTADGKFHISLVKEYLVVICYGRNAYEEYYLGQIHKPQLVKPAQRLEVYGYEILQVTNYHIVREWTTILPLLIVEAGKRVKVLFIHVGEPQFNILRNIKDLYEYEYWSSYYLQFTIFDEKLSDMGRKEIISIVDTGSMNIERKKCGERISEDNVIACDIVQYHQNKITYDLREAKAREISCELQVNKQPEIGNLSTNNYFSQNFNITIGDSSEIIYPSFQTSMKDDISIAQASTNVTLNDKFSGQVLMYYLDKRGIDHTKINYLKQFDWQNEVSKLIKQTRGELFIKDMVVLKGNIIFIQSESCVIKVHTMNTMNDFKPFIQDFLIYPNVNLKKLKCYKILADLTYNLIYSICSSSNFYYLFVSNWNSAKPKILTYSMIHFKKSATIIDIFYYKKEVIVWGVERQSQQTILQSYYLTNTGYNMDPSLLEYIPMNFFVDSKPLNFIQMVECPNFLIKYKRKMNYYNNQVISKTVVEEFEVSIDNLFVGVYNSRVLEHVLNTSNNVIDPEIVIYAVYFRKEELDFVQNDQNFSEASSTSDNSGKDNKYKYVPEKIAMDTWNSKNVDEKKDILEKKGFRVQKLLSVKQFEFLGDREYGFEEINNIKCEKESIVRNPSKFKSSDHTTFDVEPGHFYFSCVFIKKKNFHLDILFSIQNNTLINESEKLEFLNTNTAKIINYYTNYGDFESLGPVQISPKNIAIVGKKTITIPSNRDNIIGLPNTYMFIYNRTDYSPETDQKFGKYKELYKSARTPNNTNTTQTHHVKNPISQNNEISKNKTLFTESDYEQFKYYLTCLLHEKYVTQNNPRTRKIIGGIAQPDRSSFSQHTKLLFEDYRGINYLAYSSYSYYPLNFYELRDQNVIDVTKDSFLSKFQITAYNHYSMVMVQIELKDNMLMLFTITILGFVQLVVFCIIITIIYVRRNKRCATFQEVKTLINEYDDISLTEVDSNFESTSNFLETMKSSSSQPEIEMRNSHGEQIQNDMTSIQKEINQKEYIHDTDIKW